MENFKELLSKLPPVKKPEIKDTSTPTKVCIGTQTNCQRCHKPILVEPGHTLISPKGVFFDILCPDCRSVFKGTAQLVCLKCRQVICRLKPKKLDNGFEIRAGETYHSDMCGVCDPNIKTSTFLEIAAYETANKK